MDDIRVEVTLNRPHNGQEEGLMRLRVRDVASSQRILEVDIDPHALMDLLSEAVAGGREGLPARILSNPRRAHIGEKRVSVRTLCPLVHDEKRIKEVEAWTEEMSLLITAHSHNSSNTQRGREITWHRYSNTDGQTWKELAEAMLDKVEAPWETWK